MTAIVVVLLVAFAATVVIVKLLRGSIEHPSNLAQLLDSLEPVNAGCFRHLASDADDVFLRKTLPPREYRRIRRLRLRAIHAYYASALQNTSLLLSYSELLSRSETMELATFGQQLSPLVVQLRLALLRGLPVVVLCYFLPIGTSQWRRITDLYEQVGGHLGSFCKMHAPDLQFVFSERFRV